MTPPVVPPRVGSKPRTRARARVVSPTEALLLGLLVALGYPYWVVLPRPIRVGSRVEVRVRVRVRVKRIEQYLPDPLLPSTVSA